MKENYFLVLDNVSLEFVPNSLKIVKTVNDKPFDTTYMSLTDLRKEWRRLVREGFKPFISLSLK